MQVKKCKGCRDMLPADMAKFRTAEAAFRESCLRAGYSEVRTPTLEYLHLFTSAGTLTPGMLRRVYSFLDWDGWSGERVVLKPDATIPVARLYLDRLAVEKLARLFYVTNTFIFEETGAKTRERWQCGAELIGDGSPMADVDLLALSLDVCRRLGISGVNLQLSHAALIRAALSGLGLSAEGQHDLFDRILDQGTGAITGIETDNPGSLAAVRLLFGTRGESSGYLKNLRALLPNGSAGYQAALDGFIRIFEMVEALGVPCRIDMTVGKGFEYYTGLIFRVNAGELNIGGGGRYDQLISVMGGEATPAAGFALYMDRLMSLLPEERQAECPVTVICKSESFKEGAALLAELRDAGFTAGLALNEETPTSRTVEVIPAGGFMVTDAAGTKKSCSNRPEVKKRLGRTLWASA